MAEFDFDQLYPVHSWIGDEKIGETSKSPWETERKVTFLIKVLDLAEQFLDAESLDPVSAMLETERENSHCHLTTEQVQKRK